MIRSKKAQISLEDAPAVVFIVGFIFLLMATIAYVGTSFGEATDTDNLAGTTLNESVASFSNSSGNLLAAYTLKKAACTATLVQNKTSGEVVPATNYTITNCLITANANSGYALRPVNVSYTYTYSLNSQATNITEDMNTEIKGNTSIAGIVLTISLVGIVLTVLMGIFLAARRGGM